MVREEVTRTYVCEFCKGEYEKRAHAEECEEQGPPLVLDDLPKVFKGKNKGREVVVLVYGPFAVDSWHRAVYSCSTFSPKKGDKKAKLYENAFFPEMVDGRLSMIPDRAFVEWSDSRQLTDSEIEALCSEYPFFHARWGIENVPTTRG